MSRFLLLLALPLLLAACERHAFVDDLRGTSFQLIDQDGQPFLFPDDLRGQTAVVGFIFTHCPDVCPMTTANMRNVREQLGAPADVRFVSITFDPARDTPEVMRTYRKAFGLEGTDWAFLSGDSTQVDALMQRMRINRTRVPGSTMPDGEEMYFFDHTDQISLLDPQSRVFFHYGGSNTPPEILVEDIQKVR